MKKQRLTRQSWINAGFASLIKHGPSALAAEPLAREIGTTKGSFYWHFKDVPEFHTAVAKDWQARSFAAVVDEIAAQGAADQRLRRFGQVVLKDIHDPAMRAWAQENQKIAKTVAQVDKERLTYMSSVFKQLGIKNEGFAESTLGALIGLRQLPGVKKPADAFDTLIDLVLALK